MDNRPPKRTADEIESPDGKTQRSKEPKLAGEGECTCCPVCLEEVACREACDDNDDDESIFCEGDCDSWVHRRCIGLPKRVLIQHKTTNNPFFCPTCRFNKYDLLISDMKSTIASLEQKVSDLEKKNATLTTKPPPPSHNSTSIATKDNATNSKQDATPNSNIQEVVASFINEEKEKAKRRLNLMIHNVPESPSEDGLTRKKHDVDFVTKMCQTQLSTKVVLNKAYRLGKKGVKPRLLKVSLSSDAEKAAILKNSTKLRNQDASPAYKGIFITPDLTPKEQEHNKQLRVELKERNRGGREFQIKNGKIVRRKQ